MIVSYICLSESCFMILECQPKKMFEARKEKEKKKISRTASLQVLLRRTWNGNKNTELKHSLDKNGNTKSGETWNDAMATFINKILPLKRNSPFYQISYRCIGAICISIFRVTSLTTIIEKK